MGDRPRVILEKSRTVRRRYQRRKQQVVFTKAELERLERAEEKERRAKKLQENEKRRKENKKKRLEKEAIAREERKKSGLPDPNARISSSQQLLSNFFGKKDKSESLEDDGDTEVDTDDCCGSETPAGPRESVDCSEIKKTNNGDSFDDDDTVTLFNDENVLKEINRAECVKKQPGVPVGKEAKPLLSQGRTSSCNNESKSTSDQASGDDTKPVANYVAPSPPADAVKDKSEKVTTVGVKTGSKVAGITDSDPFDDALIEEIFDSNPTDISSKPHVVDGTTQGPRETNATTTLYQDAEDVLAGLCTQDFADDDDEEENEKAPDQASRPTPKIHGQQNPPDDKPLAQLVRPPLRDIAPTSLNVKNPETTNISQKQKDATKTTIQPHATTNATTTSTTFDDDEYGSFSFSDEDLLYLGV